MTRRWTVLLGLIALIAAGWLLATSGVFRRNSQLPPRAERLVVPRDLSTGDESEGDAASGGGAAGTMPLPEPIDLDAVDRDRDLHGIVVREADGAPIAGAELRVVSYPWRRASVLHYDGYFESVDGPKTKSARDGTFSLRPRPGTEVALLVRAEGYAPVELRARQAGERLRVEMQEGVRLTIVTRDEQGNGVAGTRLRLWRTDGDAPTLLGVTDDEGRSSIGTLPVPAVYTVDVQPERLGYHSWETVTLPEGGDVEHVVTLVEGRTITGRVTDAETGEAIPDARIGMNWVMVPFTVSDDKGRYELPGWLGKGMNDLHCVADEYGREQWVVDGDTHDFKLSRGDQVTGRLIGADGRPVGGAPVSSIGSKHGRDGQGICTRAGTSDALGRFLLKGLRRDMPHTLIVMAEGFGRYLLDFDPSPDRPGTIDLGDLTLPEARTIAGRVLSHELEPVARVEVIVSGNNSDRGRLTGREPDRYMFYGRSESRHTDDLGRFRFGDLSPGRYTIEVRRPGAQGDERKIRLRDEDLLDVEVVLPGGREFTVTVVDEEGLPVPRVFVSVLDAAGQSGANSQTDAMGRATFFVADRATRVTAHPFASGRELLRADVPVEDDVSEFRLVLKRAATIKGTVLGEDGRPFANAWISVKTSDNRGAAALSGADGTFSLEVPMGEAFDLVFTGQRGETLTDYISEPVRAEAGATGVEIRLRRVARDRTLRVKVVFPDGTPVQGVWVFAERSRAETGADGIASFTGLPAREVGVSATTPPERKDVIWATPMRVVPAGQEVTLTLRTALPISGIVLMSDGAAAADASVQVRVAEAGLLRVCYRASTDAQGRFSVPIAADEPGPWILHAERKDKGLSGETKDVRTGDADIRIQLK